MSATSPSAGPNGENRMLDRGVARKHAFLEAAREIFLEHGYEAASVNEIVRLAGGSLATLYSQYGSKEGLFLAVMADQGERVRDQIMPHNYEHLPLREGLRAFADRYMDVVLAPDHLKFFRVSVGEGRNFPQMLKAQMSTNVDKLGVALTNFLQTHPDENGVVVSDPASAADHFFDIVRGRWHYRAIYDVDFVFSEADRNAHVKSAIEFFLKGALAR